MVSVEVACHDDMFVIWYVVVWETSGEVRCYRIYGHIVISVIVHIQYGDQTHASCDLYPCNVSTPELELFVAVC